MNYGYARVSTGMQDKDKTQRLQFEYLKNKGVPEANIFYEHITGTKREGRVKLQALIDKLQPGDVIYVMKLDRLARNTKDALDLADTIRKHGAILDVGGLGRVDDTPTGKLILTIFGGFAEFEAALIRDRLQGGRQYKREHVAGYREGRRRKLTEQHYYDAIKRHENGETWSHIADYFGISRRTMMYRIKEIKAKQLAEEEKTVNNG